MVSLHSHHHKEEYMKNDIKFWGVFFLLFGCLAITGCDLLGLTKDIDITGTWKLVEYEIDGEKTTLPTTSPEKYSFNADGSAVAKNDLFTDNFKYSVEKNKVTITNLGMVFSLQNTLYSTYPYEAKIDGSTLTLAMNAGGSIGKTKFTFTKMTE